MLIQFLTLKFEKPNITIDMAPISVIMPYILSGW